MMTAQSSSGSLAQEVLARGWGSGSNFASAPGWFIMIVALAYATGFLIVSTFLGSFGIQDASADFLRPKYLQVGFFFLLLFGSILVLVLALIKAGHLRKNRAATTLSAESDNAADAKRRDDLALQLKMSIPIWTNALLFIYLAVGFAEPGEEAGRSILITVAILLLATVGGSVRIYKIAKDYAGDKVLPPLIKVLYVLLFSILLVADGFIIWPFRGKLLDLVWFHWFSLLRPVVLLSLVAILGWLIYRGVTPRPEFSAEEHRIFMWPRLAIGLAVYYLCVLSFTFGIYPFMSSSRGGGYYYSSVRVRVTVREGGDILGPSLIDPAPTPRLQSKPLILIEQTSNAVFVADPEDPRKLDGRGGAKCWTDFWCRPAVTEIQSSDVLKIQHIPLSDR